MDGICDRHELSSIVAGNEGHARKNPGIFRGNAAVHHGDWVTDALLYEGGERPDAWLMVRIYALKWQEVLSTSEFSSFYVGCKLTCAPTPVAPIDEVAPVSEATLIGGEEVVSPPTNPALSLTLAYISPGLGRRRGAQEAPQEQEEVFGG